MSWFEKNFEDLHGRANEGCTSSSLTGSISLAQEFTNLVKTGTTPLEIVAPPQLSLVVFRLHPPKQEYTFEQLDELNQRFWSEMQTKTDEFVLTQTILPEIGFCFRLAVGSPRTQIKNIKETYDAICKCATRMSCRSSMP